MAERIIETKAVISAQDKTGSTFADIAKKLKELEKVQRQVDAAGVKDAQRVQRAHAEQQRAIRAVGDMAAVYATMKAREITRAVLDTYRDFDKERRYAKAVMGITDAQQEPLVKQAIHGGATTKFNDIQWLEAQREFAARGLNIDQVRGLTEVAATIGQAMDKSLPESVKALEGAMFGFHKDTSTYEAAVKNGSRTADLIVKGSKISGMDYNDLVELYKFSGTPFRMANLSEEELLAFGGIGKKSNIGGAEMGTAARALVANLLSPTAGAKTAMLANGIDYSKYQTMNTKPMDAAAFSQDIAMKYGVALHTSAQKTLQHLFNDKALVADAAKFMPAVMHVLDSVLGGKDAKSKKSIAGEARRYRDASVASVDSEKLFRDLMVAIAKSPNLANVIFGSKQGGRIRAAMGDPEIFLKKLDELVNHSDGYAKDVSDQRMAGFDGAVSHFEGATKNLETAIGRALDNGGKGGFLTHATDAAGRFVQALAEADPKIIKLGTSAAIVGAGFAAIKASSFISSLTTGFGLSTSAAALDGSAKALTEAAARLAGSGAIPGAEPGSPPGKGKGGGVGGVGTGRTLFFAFNTLNNAMMPEFGTPEFDAQAKAVQDAVEAFNVWWDKNTPKWAPGHRSEIAPVIKGPSLNSWPAGWDRRAGADTTPAAPQKMQISFAEVPTLHFEVAASSSLLSVVDNAKSVALKPRADAPGGNGETSTGQH